MNNFDDYRPPKRTSRRKRQDSIFVLLFGAFLSFMCVGIVGAALYLGGFNPFIFPFSLTATALAQRNASCQVLIDKAIQSSDSYCGETGSNNVCYGNTTIQAELAPGVTQRFSERGDIIAVDDLRRLSAAPLNTENDDWGIAVFKVIANLPRSLPGETVTMVVFGNTTIDKESGGLESFYFYSELGQIACEAVPSDGLMLTSPGGSGLRINVNGTELTLKGNANLKAVQNGEMEVSLYSGSGRIVSNGQEQYFGAGQKVSVGMGGENGVQAISGPSAPEPLTQNELNTACAVTGQYCSQSQITPVSEAEAQQQIQAEITFTPTVITQTPTTRPSPTLFPTYTSFVLPSWTPRWTMTPTPTRTPLPSATRTRTPVPTRTRTRTPSPTRTRTATPTNTLIPTFTQSLTPTPACVLISAAGPTNAIPNELAMTITNDNVAPITIASFHADWDPGPTASQKLSQLLLDGTVIWNIADNTPPTTDIPTEGNWNNNNRTIAGGLVGNFVVRFQDPLVPLAPPFTYQIQITFDNGCQIGGSITVP